VGIWLRGGFTYLTASAEGETSSTGSAPTVTTRTTVSAWAFTLDPQLVLVPAPRIGITLGPLLDIPVAGTDKTVTNGQTEELEYRSSAYGITAGVAALF
ncbi:MAG: hypothetical protein K0R38_7101, partial [Polyangiaceae bacterium]|nr:hypothetical protein [Polyangiaceae bacterium]